MMTKKILIIIVLLGFSLTVMDMGLWAGTVGTPPGADVQQEKNKKKEEEKKEEEKSKKEKKVKRVWTDKDLKEIRKERLNITEVSPEPDEKKKKGEKKDAKQPAKVENTTKKEKFDPRKTEKYWRERKRALVDNIKKNESEIKNMEVKLFKLKNQLNGTDFYSDRVRLEQEIRDTYNKLQNYKQGLERLKQALENLHDEARKAGALPGWLRD
jgi:hypothetical protein